MDSASEVESLHESDASSIDGINLQVSGGSFHNASRELLIKRLESLSQENKVLKLDLETTKLKVKALQNENKDLRQASVQIQAMAEQEEEYISNTLMKKIDALKREKETLAINYEQEEECLTNELTRKMVRLKEEKDQLEHTLEREQEQQVSKLVRKIKNLESETVHKQHVLEQLRREKVELENALEQEQEALVNRLWKRMDQLESEKRMLQGKINEPVSMTDDASLGGAIRSALQPVPQSGPLGEQIQSLQLHITRLRDEVSKLKDQLTSANKQHAQQMQEVAQEEKQLREENLRLQRRLQMEVERREMLCRHLSESESSLEMEDERHFNELSKTGHLFPVPATAAAAVAGPMLTDSGPASKNRAVSSPIPYGNPLHVRTMSPAITGGTSSGLPSAHAYGPPSPARSSVSSQSSACPTCGQSMSITPASSTAHLVSTVALSSSPPPPFGPNSMQGVLRSNSHQRLTMQGSTNNSMSTHSSPNPSLHPANAIPVSSSTPSISLPAAPRFASPSPQHHHHHLNSHGHSHNIQHQTPAVASAPPQVQQQQQQLQNN